MGNADFGGQPGAGRASIRRPFLRFEGVGAAIAEGVRDAVAEHHRIRIARRDSPLLPTVAGGPTV